MASSPPPNLFSFASSELSQDAFICWLISWAYPGFSEEATALHETALELIEALFEKHGHSYDTPPNSVEVRQQYNDMDVVVVLDGETVLLIEDKVHASAHSGQLGRYRSTLIDEFGKENVFPIYFKTGDQSDFQHARENGYEPFLREDFLEVLDSGFNRGANNDIFRNYHEHLREMQRKVESFEGTPVDGVAKGRVERVFQAPAGPSRRWELGLCCQPLRRIYGLLVALIQFQRLPAVFTVGGREALLQNRR